MKPKSSKNRKRNRSEVFVFFILMISALFIYYRGRRGVIEELRVRKPEITIELKQDMQDIPSLLDLDLTVDEEAVKVKRDPFVP